MGVKRWAAGLAAASLMLPAWAQAGEAGDLLRTHLYEGTIAEGLAAVTPLAEAGDPEAKFAAGLLTFVDGLQGVSQDLYKYGATTPDTGVLSLLGMMGAGAQTTPANPNPEPITYEKFRTLLQDLVDSMDEGKALFEAAGENGDYVVALEPLKFRFDADGDGTAEPGETLGDLLGPAFGWADTPFPDGPPPREKKKGGETPAAEQKFEIGFDRADAIWFAGYTQVVAAQADFLLAHDFHELVDAYFHRFFPKSGLPMQDQSNGMIAMDPSTDASIADVIAAVHTLDFPVTDKARLAGVRQRLLTITALSRKNWDAIMAETDDNHELVPSPTQTPPAPQGVITPEKVAAWRKTLDVADRILNGELLVPHWRFKQGFDLKAYFETATETDLVMIVSGLGALPFLKDGPVASAESFADANEAFGAEWFGYAFWFN
jgi:hypothetical protein